MDENKVLSQTELQECSSDGSCWEKKTADKKEWEKPTLEDVSGKVMAQPYIRFT